MGTAIDGDEEHFAGQLWEPGQLATHLPVFILMLFI